MRDWHEASGTRDILILRNITQTTALNGSMSHYEHSTLMCVNGKLAELLIHGSARAALPQRTVQGHHPFDPGAVVGNVHVHAGKVGLCASDPVRHRSRENPLAVGPLDRERST